MYLLKTPVSSEVSIRMVCSTKKLLYIMQGGQPNLKIKSQEFSRSIPRDFNQFSRSFAGAVKTSKVTGLHYKMAKNKKLNF